jgi:hypothetical protein
MTIPNPIRKGCTDYHNPNYSLLIMNYYCPVNFQNNKKCPLLRIMEGIFSVFGLEAILREEYLTGKFPCR